MSLIPTPAGPHTSTIKNEFNLAAQVMMSVMPRGFETGAFAFDLRYRPMIGIGGDHAAVEPLPDGCFFTVSDVTGHGIAAALMVRDVCGFIRGQAGGRLKPARLVGALNAYLLKVFSEAGIFMTFFCGRLDLRKGVLVYCGAGHPPPLLLGPNRPEPLRLVGAHPILGAARIASPIEGSVELREHDRLLLYTDGIIETRNAGGELFGIERLEALCVPQGLGEPGEHLDRVIAAADAFRGDGSQRDDLLVAAIEVRDPGASSKRMRRPKR